MYNPDDQTTIIGDLADSWEWAEDGNSVTFRLPANAQWTDGTPLTADDIVFSLDRMSDLTKIRPRVRNIAPYYKDSVALDPQTVQVNTKFSNPAALLPFLATGYMVMLPKHVLDGRADAEEYYDTPENIVGSGAFKFVSHERGSSMELERNPNYFKEGLPFLDLVTAFVIADKNTHMGAFITGQIDFSPGMGITDTDAISFVDKIKGKGTQFYNGPNLMRFYEINYKNPPVDDPKVRRALYLALDREEINRVRRLGNGRLGVPFFPGTQWSSNDEEIATWPGYRYVDKSGTAITTGPYGISGVQKDPRDIEEAKALLAEAGHPDGVTIEYHTYALLKEVPVLLKEQFAKIGVDLQIKITDTTTGFNAEQAGDYKHLLGLGHGPNIVDPDDLFLGIYMPGGPRNALKYEDPRIVDIFEKQKSEADLEKRIQLIRQAEEILRSGEGHFHNIFWFPAPTFVVSDRVKNYNVTAITVQYGFQKEHIWLD
jgi:peptide/nickel transport system substrate-binding protein